MKTLTKISKNRSGEEQRKLLDRKLRSYLSNNLTLSEKKSFEIREKLDEASWEWLNSICKKIEEQAKEENLTEISEEFEVSVLKKLFM